MSSPCVLVVDDDFDICQIVELAMGLEGVRVRTAENGAVALTKLGEGDLPSLILLDLMMPVMDGWSFLDAVARDPNYGKIPVVIMTAFEGEMRPIPPSAGFLRKPMSLDSLRGVLRKFLPSVKST